MHRKASLGLLALAALVLAAPARAAEVDKLLPNDTETVLHVNVKQILTSPLGKNIPVNKLRDALNNEGEAGKILGDLGFDPFRDLTTITVASSSGSEPDKGLLIVHGKFDVAKFKAKAEEVAKDMGDLLKIHKVPNGPAGGTPLYEVNAPGANQTLYVALAGGDTLVASAGKDYVLDALDKAAGKRTTTLKSAELKALLGRLDAKQSAWMAVLGSTLAKSPLPTTSEDAKQVIDKLQDATLSLTIDKDIKLELSVTAKSADDAKELNDKIKDGLNTALGFAALAAGNKKELTPLVDLLKTVKPSIKEKVVSVEIEVPGDKIQQAIDKNKPRD